MSSQSFANLDAVAAHLRKDLETRKYLLLYAYNGTGKTRLSMVFKDAGKQGDTRDTLYFNAFTEDLFTWDNDLDGDSERVLKINSAARFFAGLKELEMDTRIRAFLHRYVDFDFVIDYEQWTVRFFRNVQDETFDNIKISRGEENIFIWCFFLVIVQLAIDGAEAYRWVKYIYIDDPISSLDENNAIAVGNHLAQIIKKKDHSIKIVLSSHHSLFFNVIWNELHENRKKFYPYFLTNYKETNQYSLRYTNDTPFYHHVAMLVELCQAAESDRLYTYHFSMLRTILEKSASFHGFTKFSACIEPDDKEKADDPDGNLQARLINILSHGNYSLFEPREMLEENKAHFRKILGRFLKRYPFDPELFLQEAASP
jgi:wobble nucleotide-excising tRNase